jgi:hypothetical protein
MSYGFSCLNDSGLTIIDDTFANYQLYSYGTLSTSTTVAGSVSHPEDAVVLFAPTAYSSTVCYFAGRTGTTTSLTASTIGGPYNMWGRVAATMYYIVIRPSNTFTAINSGYGFSVYNSGGTQTFSTNRAAFDIKSAQYQGTGTLVSYNMVAIGNYRSYIDFGITQVYAYAYLQLQPGIWYTCRREMHINFPSSTVFTPVGAFRVVGMQQIIGTGYSPTGYIINGTIPLTSIP